MGNIGLYYVCYELSKLGWNVLPTSRNTKGIDLVIFNQSATRRLTIQVKSLSKEDPVPFGHEINNLLSEYLIICTRVSDERNNPKTYVAKMDEVKNKIKINKNKANKKSYWLEKKDYEKFSSILDVIGRGDD